MAKISNTAARNSLNEINSLLNADGNAQIKVYRGTVPALVSDTISSQVLLATLTMSTTAFAGAVDNVANNRAEMSAGQASYEIADDSSAVDAGAPTFVRLVTGGSSNPVQEVVQLSAGVGTGEVSFAAEISTGSSVSISSLMLIQNEG